MCHSCYHQKGNTKKVSKLHFISYLAPWQLKVCHITAKYFGHSMYYVWLSRFYWHFWANLVMHICSMLQVCIIAIWSQGLILNSGRSYATFGTKIPVFRANSGCLLGTKWQKWWIYKNVSRIVKTVHSELADQPNFFLQFTIMYDFPKSTDIFVNPSFLPFCTPKGILN